jgi:hypothetical protein
VQKLVTVYLDAHAYMDGKWLKGTHANKHGLVEEYLKADLADGWKVVSLVGFGGADGIHSRGWLAVVLEKQ